MLLFLLLFVIDIIFVKVEGGQPEQADLIKPGGLTQALPRVPLPPGLESRVLETNSHMLTYSYLLVFS